MKTVVTAKPLPRTSVQMRSGVCVVAFSERSDGAVMRTEPSGTPARIVLPLGGKVKASLADREAKSFEEAFVVAAGASPVSTSHSGQLDCIEILLPPWGPRLLLGERPVAMDGPVSLAEMGVATAVSLGGTDYELSAWIDRTLRDEHCLPSREVRYVTRRLQQSKGRTRVSTLADEVGWSERHLSARFANATGMGPKRFARLVRFEAARHTALTTTARLADIAAACGYADQAHMTREFSEFAGSSPAAVRARSCRIISDNAEFVFFQAGPF